MMLEPQPVQTLFDKRQLGDLAKSPCQEGSYDVTLIFNNMIDRPG